MSTRVPWLISLSTFPNQETSPDLDDRSSMGIRRTIDLGVTASVSGNERYAVRMLVLVLCNLKSYRYGYRHEYDLGPRSGLRKRHQSVGSQHIERNRDRHSYQSCSVGVVHKADRRRQTQ